MADRFFSCCPACRRTFTDPYIYREHMMRNHPATKTSVIELMEEEERKRAEREGQRADAPPPVLVGNDDAVREHREEEVRERTRDLQEMKSRLYSAGIECQTLDAAATRKLYDKALQDGVIQ